VSDIELNPIVLGPCLRDGEPGDWWGKKCTQCTASHHTPLGIVKCACPHHGGPVTTAEGTSMAATTRTTKDDADG
jgi:hypothetical protein